MKKFAFLTALFLINGAILLAQTQEKFLNEMNEMIVMSYNIRYDNPGDGVNRWDNRKDRVTLLLQYYHPDIVGLQEALLRQINYLDSALQDYSWVGVGRDDGKEKGEFSPVFFDANKYEIIDWSTFWLSSNPDNPSTGWDAALPRICTLVKFRQLSSNRELYFLNTHFDHRGEKARQESSKLIVNRINKLDRNVSVILAGDFNHTPDSDGYKTITSTLKDAAIPTDPDSISYGPEGTFSGFESGNELGNRIDYIFISKDLKCTKFRTVTDHNGTHYPSDHLPVLAVIGN